MANCSGSVSSPTFALEEKEEEDSGQAGEHILEDAQEVSLLRPKFLFVRRYWASGGSCPGSVCGLAANSTFQVLPSPYHLGSGFQEFQRTGLGETRPPYFSHVPGHP